MASVEVGVSGRESRSGREPSGRLGSRTTGGVGIQAVIGAEIVSFAYQYPGRPPIFLRFFHVREYSGNAVNREFAEIRWEHREKLPNYDFLEADSDLVRDLARGAGQSLP